MLKCCPYHLVGAQRYDEKSQQEVSKCQAGYHPVGQCTKATLTDDGKEDHEVAKEDPDRD